MAAAKYVGAGLAAIGLTGAGMFKRIRLHQQLREYNKGTQAFFEQVFEVDSNQPSSNVFIIAKRFMDSKQLPNADIINEVLRLEESEKINSDSIKLFSDLYSNRTKFDTMPLDRKDMETFRSLSDSDNRKPAGVYIFSNKDTGAQCVGSSKDLTIRVRDHYYGRSHGRLAQELAKVGVNKFTLDIVVLPSLLATEANILALEQYLMFLLHPSINFLKVANSSHKVYSQEQIASMRASMGDKVYVYYLGKLVHIFNSVRHCFQTLGERDNFSHRVLKRMKGVYRVDLLFTKTPILSAEVDLMSLPEFLELFNKVKQANKRVQAMPSNTQPVLTTRNGVDKEHRSMAAATKWLEQMTGIKCNRITLTNTYLNKDVEFHGYKLTRLHKEHKGFIYSSDENTST